eukprot:TRINITY_DN3292_c0_g2_i1.p3 TRINITY_DN3292_c0_g2~~TRINITY_DN3292_c0_g2_i1.p3  ORF type:complete len:96 (-),score=14.78 TRINITY_DN3292_c0_g2_i1:338-625(-)
METKWQEGGKVKEEAETQEGEQKKSEVTKKRLSGKRKTKWQEEDINKRTKCTRNMKRRMKWQWDTKWQETGEVQMEWQEEDAVASERRIGAVKTR